MQKRRVCEPNLIREKMWATKLELLESRSTTAAVSGNVTACYTRLDTVVLCLSFYECLKEPRHNELRSLEQFMSELKQDTNDRGQELLLINFETTAKLNFKLDLCDV